MDRSTHKDAPIQGHLLVQVRKPVALTITGNTPTNKRQGAIRNTSAHTIKPQAGSLTHQHACARIGSLNGTKILVSAATPSVGERLKARGPSVSSAGRAQCLTSRRVELGERGKALFPAGVTRAQSRSIGST